MTLKLAKIPNQTPVKVTATFPREIHETLKDYAILYEQNYGVKVKVEDLIPFMIEGFLNSDHGFKKARRQLLNINARPSTNTINEGDS